MSQRPFILKNAKQKLTRILNTLDSLLQEAREFEQPWAFPTQAQDLELFLISKGIMVKNLMSKLQQRRDDVSNFYAECNRSINDLDVKLKAELEEQFDAYWLEKKGEELLRQAEEVERKLERRVVELQCQEVSFKQELNRDQEGETLNQFQPSNISLTQIPPTNTWSMERRFLGNELKVPNFYGDSCEFDSFWELFQELVHKQPYSNIEKLSILINCCKGDAARTLQMIPRTGEAYERAVNQLKSQYQDPRRTTMQMIRKLKSMKQCQDDHRALRNNLSDVQAIIATLEKQGEAVNTTNMRTMVLETFSKSVQDEMARKEFDSGNLWSMTDLLNNLTIAIKRKEHVEGMRDIHQEERSIFHASTTIDNKIRCTGCGRRHRFQYCNKYPTIAEKTRRLRELNACWKCFSPKHPTEFCRKQNCSVCGGPHNLIMCRQGQRDRNSRYSNIPRQRYTSPLQGQQSYRTNYQRRRSHTPRGNFKSRSSSPIKQFHRNRSFNSYQYERSPQRQSLSTLHKPPSNGNIVKRSPSPRRTSDRQVRFSQSPEARRRSSSFENITVNLQIQENQPKEVSDEFTNSFINSNNVRLMVVPVQLQNPSEQGITVLALLDSASDQSFISTSLVKRMNLKTQKETTIVVNTFGGRAEKKQAKRVVTSLYNSEGDHIKVELLTSDNITPPLQMGLLYPQDRLFIQEHFSDEELRRIMQTVSDTVTPDILIGMDYFNTAMKLNEPTIRLPSGLFLTPTFFGPVISGVPHNDNQQPGRNDFSKRFLHTYTNIDSNNQHMDISELWKLNTIGIEDMTTDEEVNNQIVSDFYSSVKVKDNKIFVRLPWKSNKKCLSNNYNLALSRLHQLYKMKDRNPQCWAEYCSIIDDQLKKNFIEDVPPSPASNSTPCYYIPHQAVIKAESATTKTRIVLDASSKMKGELSLNDVVHQGPLILPNLCGVLIRSRVGSKIMIADVEKAFHMIHLQEIDRDAVRFLWLKDVSQPPSPSNLRILRFCRLPFGINASPFLLGISIKYGVEMQSNLDKNFQNQLNDNLYVDNVLLTDDSTKALIEKYKLCKQVFGNMSMNLRQFITNDDICNKSIAPADLSTSKSVKILGIPWDHQKDSFSIKCKLQYSPTLTKRKVLQTTHSTFDPLGLLIPLLLPAKLFLQDLWKLNYKWDEELSPDLKCEWQSICENAAGFEASVPRAVSSFAANKHYEILTFVDASIRSFAAVCYLRTIDDDGTIRSNLLMARQRLAPIKKNAKTITIPRLELLALLIGVRLTSFVIKEVRLPITKVYVFSDSQVALNWVQSNSKNGAFVDNRCGEIRSKMQSWSDDDVSCHLHYLPSEINPADCATKGLTRDQLLNHMWWTGPSFIVNETSKWPALPEFSWTPNERKENPDPDEPGHTVLAMKHDPGLRQTLFQKEYSSFKKYKRVLVMVLKFLKHMIYNKISTKNKEVLKKALPEIEIITDDKPLTSIKSIDALMSERMLIKSAQKTLTQNEIAKLNNLHLYTDEYGLVRCCGRIQAKHLAKETQEPILLPENHNFTRLIVEECHNRCGHQGVNGTLANVRLNYWVPKGRQTVKRQLKSCLICKKWNSKPFFYPNSPPLPQSRTEPTRPFLHVGIDLAGPFRVLSSENKEQKKWILLATCMITRAIHLEIVNNLSAVEVINGLRRFVARRGKPILVMSDNATNFTLGCEIIETLNDRTGIPTPKIQNFLTNEGIKWKFITPLSPWKGGFYERMIGVMKSVFKRITRKKLLMETEFSTVIPECEAMVNSRPLTYTGSTVEDSAILRPIDFIIPYANVNLLPPTNPGEEDPEYIPTISTKEQAIQQFQRQLSYLQDLWKFWTNNYLLELRNFHQRRIKQKSFTRKKPYVGEVVLIMEEDTPRGDWPLGLVTKLITDQDGNIRTVEVKTAKSKLTRSINLLIPLEIEEKNNSEHTSDSKSSQQETKTTTPQESGAKAPQQSDTVRRTRPWLPRRAKEQTNYCAYATQAHNENRSPTRANAYWQRWLLLTLLASCCMSAQSKTNTGDIVQCTKGGIRIQMPQIQDKMQVCANDYCLEIDHPEPLIKVQFPAEITLHSYHIVVKMVQGNLTQAFHWACSPSPFCEQIACTFCTPMLTNPECWPRIAIVLGATIFYVVLITAYLVVYAGRRLCRGCSKIWSKIKTVKNLCLSRNRVQRAQSTEYVPLVEINGSTGKKWRTSTFIRLMTISTIRGAVLGCQQVVLIPAEVTQCNSKDQICNNHTTIIAKFNSMQSELCLQIKFESFRIHLMKITLQELVLKCQKETLYYTQNTRTQVQYRKRCPHMGSCKGLKCAQISTDSMVEELEIANNFTGITYCTESCGGLGCSCGFPSSGCLFYRIYHVPIDDDVYEVFQCPSWYETLKFKVEYTDKDQNERTYTGEIKPYTERMLGKTRIEVTAFSFLPVAMQFKRFITNNKTTAYLDDETSFSYACATIPSNSNPLTNICSIRDTCRCNPAEDSISCYCTHNNVSQMTSLSHTLPVPISNGLVVAGPKRLPIIRTSAISVEAAIYIDPTTTRIAQNIIEFNCNIAPEAFTGCYNCQKGAMAFIECTTNVRQSTAQVTCGVRQFVLTCTRTGYRNEVRLFFDKAQIREQCHVQCGSQITILELQGTLHYINGMQALWQYSKISNNYTQHEGPFDIEWPLPDFNHFFAICKTFYMYTLIVLIGIPSLAVISILYLCPRNAKYPTAASNFSKPLAASIYPALPWLVVPFFLFRKLLKLILFMIRLPIKCFLAAFKTLLK